VEKSDRYTPPGAYRRVKQRRPLIPSLVEGLCRIIPINATVIDIGAGKARYLRALRDHGYQIFGVDGTPNIEEATDGLVLWADLTADCSHLYNVAEWGLFIEVGEHVPKEYEQALFDQVSKIPSKGLIVTWAGLGQSGRSHVNCQPAEYVKQEFCKREWVFDTGRTRKAKHGIRNRIRRRLLVFRRTR